MNDEERTTVDVAPTPWELVGNGDRVDEEFIERHLVAPKERDE